MWIVRLALDRPYTFIVAALLVLILGVLAILRTPTDIFPNLNIPVVSVIWNYSGLPPEEIQKRIVTNFERAATTTVNDIEHMESQSYFGVGVIKIFFQPKAKIEGAIAQVTAISQTLLHSMPPGITPPLIISYSASSVPVLQLSLGSKTLSEQQLNDLATNFLRTQLATIEGASIPLPFGGKVRQVTVDLDPRALLANGVSGSEVVNAVGVQNLILPQGTVKIGEREYNVALNSSSQTIEGLNDLPIKVVNGATIYVRDVAHVHDGFQFQTNVVHLDGHRSALLMVIKSGNASTLDIVSRVRAALPRIATTLPPDLEIQPIADQSLFVRASVQGVLKEAVIAACLTAAMILLFIGSLRSTIIVAISIPLSILCSLLTLSALGETINVMTLGGLALAVGILVDDATVEIENVNRLLPEGKPLRETILTGAQQIAVPAFVATLSICIVFVPILFLSGIAGFLFRPLAEAVVFAMLASYLLSRTLVPTLVFYFFRAKKNRPGSPEDSRAPAGFFKRLHLRFEKGFERFRERYLGALKWCLGHRLLFAASFLSFCAASFVLFPFLGKDLFPSIDSGQIRLHFRAPAGVRIEETADLCGLVEQAIRREIPEKELANILDNIGLPNSGINLTYSNSGTIGTSDADILISLTPDHRPTAIYLKKLRQSLPREFPGSEFFFQPADIVSQILNFGLPAPIDLQVIGANLEANFAVAAQMLERIKLIPGAVDAHIYQLFNQPKIEVNVNRTKAQGIGFTQRDVADNLLVALTSSFQTSPNFWLSPQGVSYSVVTQTPQFRIDSLEQLRNIPVIGASSGVPQVQVLQNLASVNRGASPGVATHYDIQSVVDIYTGVQGRDLGAVAAEITKVMDEYRGKLPRGSTMTMRGQVETMNSSFLGLEAGLVFAIMLVYLIMVVNFQSWTTPFIIITALPGALAGIVWMLFLTGTTLNVPSLMGAIMSVGVATSNSILMVTFANNHLREGKDSMAAALEAGFTRLRPVLMTALAMVIGMLPMSLGLGEGGEQNAPLGRAVIGGLLLATVATLFFVPVVFSYLQRKGYPGPTTEENEGGTSTSPRPLGEGTLYETVTTAVPLGGRGSYVH
jgi:multidrug efflux pump subunit AcrB